MRPWPSGRGTVRLRLTLVYSGLFLLTGAVLIALIYILVAYSPVGAPPDPPPAPDLNGLPGPFPGGPQPPVIDDTALRAHVERQRAEDLQQLLYGSALALGIMTGVSILLGWLMAGRVLAPLGVMTTTVRRISADSFDQRLAVSGPSDELKELADTFDELLDRLQTAFNAQQRFVANASHELRTPLTLQRALAEVAIADPDADADSLRAALERVLASNEDSERLIDALLTLARSQQRSGHLRELDLAEHVRRALDQRHDQATHAGVRVESTLASAPIHGDPELIDRLITNLLDNAVRHNVDPGWVTVSTATAPGRSTLHIANSGPTLPADAVARLGQPFQRIGTSRQAAPDGHGLGLSIVAAITDTHHGTLTIAPRLGGGLDIVVEFPTPASTGLVRTC